MDYSRKISERQWNLPEKGELESRREATYIDDIIQSWTESKKYLTAEPAADGFRSCWRNRGAG